MTVLPDAEYVVLASRVALDLDGGFAVAVAARLRMLEAAGARPVLLTVDAAPPDVHEAQRREFIDRGLLAAVDSMRNLFDEVTADASWVFAAGVPGSHDPDVEYRTLTDAAGRPVLSLPVVRDDPAWHTSVASVVVHAPDGDRVLGGFGALYIAWLSHVGRQRHAASDRPLVVICESRQIGELLVGWDDPAVRVVHTVHNSHLPAPYDDPSAPLAGPWARWLAGVAIFDAVLWPTASQRDDVVARFGDPGTFFVVPNPIELGSEPQPRARDARRVVMINRLAPQKRVDLALQAWAKVIAAVPDATLDIYGEGPLRDEVIGVIADLGLSASVRLSGILDDRDAVLDTAAVFLTSTAFEGQGLAIAEAMARGVPVVSFDVRYGPRDVIDGGGVLVASGDVDALADAVIDLLCDEERRAALSAAARTAVRLLAPDAVLPKLAEALRFAVERPSRRLPATA